MKRRTDHSSIAAGSAALLLGVSLTSCSGNPARQPNFLIIITDDQRFDTMDYMPRTQERVFGEGVEFTRGYVTTSRCCPSRSSILTGMYAHNHGVLTNADTLQETTFVERLHKNGYYTGLVGKYLNSYPDSEEDPPLPEFDFWVTHLDSPRGGYYDPKINLNGTWNRYPGYLTYLERDFALEFLRLAAEQDQPFVLLFATRAPHLPAEPAPGDENLHPDLPPHRPPSFNEADISDKPNWLNEERPLNAEEIAAIDEIRRKQLQSLNAVDQSIDSLLTRLEEIGMLDDTVVIFLSDNGRFWGEHRVEEGKVFAYEESIRVPFALRYPQLVQRPRVEGRLVANIDIAPTIYELASIPIPPEVDGLSLVPLLQGKGDWREDFLVEGWPKADHLGPPFLAIHTERYVYVESEGDIAELYDLEIDPYQMQNVAEDPAYADVVVELGERLAQARASISPTPTSQP